MKYSYIILPLLLLLAGCARTQPEQPQETIHIQQTIQTEAPTEMPDTAAEETLPAGTVAEEDLPEASLLETGIVFFRGENEDAWKLTDGRDFSKVDVFAGEEICIESETAFAGMYIRWEHSPESSLLQTENWQKTVSEAGYLHEYIRLEEPVNTLKLIPSEDNSICAISLFTEGNPPAWVQAWQPPCEQPDILVFPTHSDDDALFFGALIAHYAIEADLDIQTAFLVDHDVSTRNHERLDGLWEMGIRHYPVVGTVRDHMAPDWYRAIAFHKEDDILGWQVQQLRRFRPLVAVGHDIKGEYGHFQHILNTMYLMEAVELAASPAFQPETVQQYGIWDTPKLYLHLYGEDSVPMEINVPLAGDPEGRTAFQIAEDAYAWHKSQHRNFPHVYQGKGFAPMDCSRFGLYRSKVGPDTGWDIMEHTEDLQRQ